jgi:hypothetical protein
LGLWIQKELKQILGTKELRGHFVFRNLRREFARRLLERMKEIKDVEERGGTHILELDLDSKQFTKFCKYYTISFISN